MWIVLSAALAGPIGDVPPQGAVSPAFELKKWGGLDLWVPGLPARLAPGDRLTLVHLHCDSLVGDPAHGSGATLRCRAIPKGELATPVHPPVDRWLSATFTIVEGAVDQASARAMEAVWHGQESLPSDRIVVVETTRSEVVHDTVTIPCSGGPCEPNTFRTGRTSERVVGTDLFAYVGGEAISAGGPQNASSMSGLLAALGVRWKHDHIPLLYVHAAQPTRHDAVVDAMMRDRAHARDALVYLSTVVEEDPDVRLALAFDRAMLAAALRDQEAFATAYPLLTAELALRDRQALPGPIQAALDAGLRNLDDIATGAVWLTAPFGTHPLIETYP